MAFGSPSGPPAGARQLAQLLELVQSAGHVDFKDARGPLGLTQRQSNGKFTRDEAEALIGLLEAEQESRRLEGEATTDGADERPGGGPPLDEPLRLSRGERQAAEAALKLKDVADDVLAAELQRRGWVVMAP